MPLADDVSAYLKQRARWSPLEIAFWVFAFATIWLFPGKYLIMKDTAILALFALSLDLILGYAGILSLGQAAFFGIAGYFTGLVAKYGIINEPVIALILGGLVAAATGSDGGGSIRIPAASCGLVGMKPTRGRVGSASPGWLGLSTYGALARTVSDSALMLDVMHGPVPGDPDPAPPFAGSYVVAAAAAPQANAAVTAPAEALAAPAAVAAAPAAVEAAPERPSDEPYIETARCTSCNECTQINDKMFGYDANKQASIINPDAGTYRQLVEAAENCQISIIHPGKPRNPNEPGLDELMKRAEPFL